MIGRFFRRISEFLSDVRAEIKKVAFPSRSETMGATGVVIVLVTIVSIFLSIADHLLVRVVKYLVG